MVSMAGISSFIFGTRVRDAPPPLWLGFRSSNGFIISTIVIAIFTDMFLYSVVVPVLPFALTSRAGVAEDDLQQWTSIFLSVYGAALAIGSPIAGWFSDRSKSRRTPLLLGLLAFAGATAMLCAGKSLAVLITGRILQGLSAAIVWTVGLALLSDTVSKDAIGQAMGYVGIAFSVGGLAGPLLGGVVYASGGYYAVFAMSFGLIGFDIALRLLLIEKSVAAQWTRTNSESTQLEMEIAAPSITQNNNPDDEIRPIDISPTFIASEQSEKALRRQIRMRRTPPLIRLLCIPRMLVGLYGSFVQATSLSAFDGALPLYVKDTFHWNSSGAGLIFICIVIPSLTSPFFGFLSDRFGSHGTRALTTGGFLATIPFWVSLRFVTHDTMQQKVLLCALLSCIGLGLTTGMAPLMAEIDHVIVLEEKKNPGSFGERGAAAQGFGLLNTAFALGVLIGPLWSGFVVESSGWSTMGWSFGLLCGSAAVATFIFSGGRIVLKSKKRGDAVV